MRESRSRTDICNLPYSDSSLDSISGDPSLSSAYRISRSRVSQLMTYRATSLIPANFLPSWVAIHNLYIDAVVSCNDLATLSIMASKGSTDVLVNRIEGWWRGLWVTQIATSQYRHGRVLIIIHVCRPYHQTSQANLVSPCNFLLEGLRVVVRHPVFVVIYHILNGGIQVVEGTNLREIFLKSLDLKVCKAPSILRTRAASSASTESTTWMLTSLVLKLEGSSVEAKTQ